MSDPFELSRWTPGYSDLRDWYGTFPSFHDAYINQLELSGDGRGHMLIRAFRVTNEVDEQGKCVLDKHCRVTFTFEGVRSVDLENFAPDRAILFGLELRKHKHGVEIELLPTYGVGGRIAMERVRIDFVPVDYDGGWPPK